MKTVLSAWAHTEQASINNSPIEQRLQEVTNTVRFSQEAKACCRHKSPYCRKTH